MIVADLTHLRDQVVLTPNMETAIAYLLSSGQDERPDGRVVVDGDKVYVEVQSYNTTEGPVTRFEGHRKYIDIQYVADRPCSRLLSPDVMAARAAGKPARTENCVMTCFSGSQRAARRCECHA